MVSRGIKQSRLCDKSSSRTHTRLSMFVEQSRLMLCEQNTFFNTSKMCPRWTENSSSAIGYSKPNGFWVKSLICRVLSPFFRVFPFRLTRVSWSNHLRFTMGISWEYQWPGRKHDQIWGHLDTNSPIPKPESMVMPGWPDAYPKLHMVRWIFASLGPQKVSLWVLR